jgi:hypothetical protein
MSGLKDQFLGLKAARVAWNEKLTQLSRGEVPRVILMEKNQPVAVVLALIE